MNEKINIIVQRIIQNFHPHKIILFGSYARGTPNADSDVDLLVIMPITGSKRENRIRIRTAIGSVGLAKDIFVETPEDFEKYKDIIGTISYPADKEGRILYERAA